MFVSFIVMIQIDQDWHPVHCWLAPAHTTAESSTMKMAILVMVMVLELVISAVTAMDAGDVGKR